MNKLTGSLAGLLVVLAPLARADFQIAYQLDAGAVTICSTAVLASPNNGTACFVAPTILGGVVTVTNISGSGSQSAINSEQFGSTLRVTNDTTASHTLKIWLSDQDFTSPKTPPNITYDSSIGITSTTGIGTVSLESCVDTSNGLTPPTNPFCSSPAASINNPTQSYSGSSSAHNTTSMSITSLTTTPFSLEQMITLTLGAAADVNLSTSQVLTPVPEPASITMLGGVLLFASGQLIRRKRKQSSKA